jgi:hypothetical protein
MNIIRGLERRRMNFFAVSYRRKGIVFSSSPREDDLDAEVSSIEGAVGGEDDIVNGSLIVLMCEKAFSLLLIVCWSKDREEESVHFICRQRA